MFIGKAISESIVIEEPKAQTIEILYNPSDAHLVKRCIFTDLPRLTIFTAIVTMPTN